MQMKQLRVATYARFSSTNQREESIVAQENAMMKYIKEKGYVFVARYADEAMSGTNTNRPQFQQMLVDASQNKFDLLLVHKLDRLSRDIYDSLDIQRNLYQYNVKIESVIENYEDTPEGELFKVIQMGMNQYYSRNLGREVMKGLIVNADECKHNGGVPPLGYTVNPTSKLYEINEKEAPIIRIIFNKFIDGWSYAEIADYLNLQGYKNRAGSSFTAKSAFYDILINSKYKGEYTYNRTSRKNHLTKRNHRKSKEESEIVRVPNGMPAIVSEEVFDKAQRILQERKRTKGQMKAKQTYLLSGILVCGQCGAKYHANTRPAGRNKTQYFSYRCSNRKALGPNKCYCKEIKRDELDQFVLNKMIEHLLNPHQIDYLVEAVNKQLSQRLTQSKVEEPKLKKRLADVNQQLNRLVSVLADSQITTPLETVVAKIQELERIKKELEQELEKSQDKIAGMQIDKAKIKDSLEELKEQIKTGNVPQVKRIITRLVERIVIGNETIEINYNLNGLFSLKSQTICQISKIYDRRIIEANHPIGVLGEIGKSVPQRKNG